MNPRLPQQSCASIELRQRDERMGGRERVLRGAGVSLAPANAADARERNSTDLVGVFQARDAQQVWREPDALSA
jgi:hypothetical protein